MALPEGVPAGSTKVGPPLGDHQDWSTPDRKIVRTSIRTGKVIEIVPMKFIDMNAVRSPMDFVRQVDNAERNGVHVTHGQRQQADQIRRNPDGFQATVNSRGKAYIAKKPGWWYRHGPKIGTAVTAAVGTAGVANALGLWGAVPQGAAATGGTGATGAGATGAGTTGTMGAYGTAAEAARRGMSGRDWLDAAVFGTGTVMDIAAGRSADRRADRAADIEAQAAKDALAFLKEQWEQSRADFAPWLEMGTNATNRLNTSLQAMPQPSATPPPGVARRLQNAPTMESFGVGAGTLAPRTQQPPQPLAQGGAPPGPQGPLVLNQAQPGVNTAQPVAMNGFGGAGGGGEMVQMQIGNVVKPVPAAMVGRWKARGAQVVGA